MKNNPEQEKAIESIDKNLSVIAGAGTGKTKVLTERFVHILENGELPLNREIESIVAITFTKKATQEMIERIRSEIRKNFSKGDKWRRYYRDMEKANISTIHSFCLNILRENAIASRLDPMFEVIDEYEARKMLDDSILEVLDLQIEKDPGLYELFKKMKIDRTSNLLEDIASIYNEIRTMGLSISDVEVMTLDYLESIKPMDNDDLKEIRTLVKLLIKNGPKNSKISKLLDSRESSNFLNGEEVEDLDRLLSYIQENIGSNKKEQENIDALEIAITRALKALERDNLGLYRAILRVLSKVDLIYSKKKEKFAGLDYEDLQIKTDKLLEDKEIRDKYQNKYKYIMIDEFQDTNKLQKQIFYKIASREDKLDRDNLFVVGDPKQSIYGFRGADLDVFYDVVDDIKTTNKEGLISLNKNYRTVDTVIAFVNNIFGGLMKDNYSSLSPHKISKDEIDIEIISNDRLSCPEGVSESEYHRHFEAEQIAKRISVLVGAGSYKYKDFSMLFRATTRNHIYEKALNKFGIPYYNVGSKGFFKQQEIIDTINALKSINNIEDRISTLGFLRSNFIGLNDNSIYHIFADLNKDDRRILDSIERLLDLEGFPIDEKSKLEAALEIYLEIEKYRDVYGIVDILEDLFDRSLYINTSLLKEDGRQKFANVYKFIEIAREYEEKNIANLEGFLSYIDDIRANDEGLGEIESENTDAVKILTIHKSKGLEFPVVIIPEMATRSPNFSKKFLFDKDTGLSIAFGKANPIYNNIRASKLEKEKEEIKRVLYVAMTRAEKMLILGNQGRSSGFKKLIEDLLDGQEYRYIDEIDLESKEKAQVKLIPKYLTDASLEKIENDHLETEKLRISYLPNLYQVDSYGKEFGKRISVSKYMVFKECKRKYYLERHLKISNIEASKYTDMQLEKIESSNLDLDLTEYTGSILEDEDPLITPIEKGLIVHDFCENYRLGMDKKDLIEKIVHKNGLDYSEEIYSFLETNINNYLSHYSEDYDHIYYEKPFFLQLDGAYISGYIDKLAISDGKIIIEDFKTNKLYKMAELVEKYTPQIQLYSYVSKRILNLPIESASILFLENGEKIELPVDDLSLKENVDRIQAFINFIRNKNKVEFYEKTRSCSQYCKYRSICDLKEEGQWENT